MPENIYTRFNKGHFSPEKYKKLREEIFALAGDTCMRMCETPVFVSCAFANGLVQGATEIIQQAMSPALRDSLNQAVPPEFDMPSAPDNPTFFIIDFAVTAEGPKLIEMQAFAANLMFIPAVAKIYRDIYNLGEDYQCLLSDNFSVKKTILGGHAPENVVLLEIDPWQQKSRRDFVVTQKLLGIPVVDITDVVKQGNRLFYPDTQGKLVRIHRVYNRVVPTEFQKLRLSEKTQFRFSDDLDVEWAGDPGWFMRISKFTMPHLDHPLVPETKFLDQVSPLPSELENYVLKPVFLNAGTGVKLNITQADIDAIPLDERRHYILMRKVNYSPFIPDPDGNMRNAEIRVMFVWPDSLEPVAMSARVMRGNDVNANLWGDDPWCGLSPVLVVD